jgi:hypothetical protein
MKGSVRCLPILRAAAAAVVVAGFAAPVSGLAAEIGWIQTNVARTATADGSTSTCRADFKNGDRADVSTVCKYGPPDTIGWATWTCESEYRFKDGSGFFLTFKGHNEPGGRVSNASAAFKGGAGRFTNMAGTAFGVGYAGKMQWNGTYSGSPGK